MKNCPTHSSLSRRVPSVVRWLALSGSLLAASLASAATTNAVTFSPALPDVGGSIMRVVGAMAIVISVFLGCVWLFRNWQRLVVHRGKAPQLNVLEVRSLGGRQSIYVVGYQQERFLLASSSSGVSFLSHLPTASDADATPTDAPSPAPSFAEALKKVLKGK